MGNVNRVRDIDRKAGEAARTLRRMELSAAGRRRRLPNLGDRQRLDCRWVRRDGLDRSSQGLSLSSPGLIPRLEPRIDERINVVRLPFSRPLFDRRHPKLAT